ncbi:MAG: hypothetical protein K9J80_16910 [Sulfuritalea sp.]|nr:hypothetical protein [Sulfuritalea sp.]
MRPITITAFDEFDLIIDLSTTALADTFSGSGPTTWNGSTGQLRMLTGSASDNGGIVDLSGLEIYRLNVSYTAPDTLDGFSIGIASNRLQAQEVPVPGTVALLLAGVSILGFGTFRPSGRRGKLIEQALQALKRNLHRVLRASSL